MGQYEDRKDYAKGSLDGRLDNPTALLFGWLDAAKAADPQDYNAMTLSTRGLDGNPEARIVLLREVEEASLSLVFYTNYASAKGEELLAHPHAAVTFFWRDIERQLRVRGSVARLSSEESDRYFASRPRASQIGAWTSNQSATILNREALEVRRKAMEAQFPNEVSRPPHWGGYRLRAESIEFWQGRPGRLHDRILFNRQEEGWASVRLQP